MFNIANITGYLTQQLPFAFLTTPKAVIGSKLKSNEKVGIEVELEKVKTKSNRVPYWNQTTDGSLKIRGKEFTICVYSNKVKQAIHILKDFLQTKDTSQRTSVHVHLNVEDLNRDALLLLTFYYFIFETPLMKYSGGRFGNFFCVPINQWWTGSVSKMTNWNKYSSINIFPTTHENKNVRLNTVEFRSMRGNLNEDYIQNWVDLLVNLKQFAKEQSLHAFASFIADSNTTSSYYPLLKQVFKNKVDLLYYPEIEKDIETSISLLKFHMLNNRYFAPDIEKLLKRYTTFKTIIHPNIYSTIRHPETPLSKASKMFKPMPATGLHAIQAGTELHALQAGQTLNIPNITLGPGPDTWTIDLNEEQLNAILHGNTEDTLPNNVTFTAN